MKLEIKSFDSVEMNGADITSYVKGVDAKAGFIGTFIQAAENMARFGPALQGAVGVEFNLSGRLFAMRGRFEWEGCIFTDYATGERWKLRNGEWLPTWPRIAASTRKPQGRDRYQRRYANGRK